MPQFFAALGMTGGAAAAGAPVAAGTAGGIGASTFGAATGAGASGLGVSLGSSAAAAPLAGAGFGPAAGMADYLGLSGAAKAAGVSPWAQAKAVAGSVAESPVTPLAIMSLGSRQPDAPPAQPPMRVQRYAGHPPGGEKEGAGIEELIRLILQMNRSQG